MFIKFSALSLATLALCVIAAPAASAQMTEIELETESAFLTGTTTEDVFTAGSSEISCSHARFSGSTTSPTTAVSVTPEYTGCTAFGIANTHIQDTGCSFVFTLRNEHSASLSTAPMLIELNCGNPATGHIVVTPTFPIFGGSICTITLTTQKISGTKYLSVSTGPTPDHFDVEEGSSEGGITYNVVNSGLGCPSVGHHADGNYHSGVVTVKAYSNAGHTSQIGGKITTN